MKLRTKRHNFVLSERTDKLLRKMKIKTESSLTDLIKEAVDLLAEKKGVNDE